MGGNWQIIPIGSVATIFDGPHATPAVQSSGPVFLGIDSLSNGRLDLANTRHVSDEVYTQWTRRVQPQSGDLVFSYETRIGQAALIPEGLMCCLGRRLALARADRSRVTPEWLLYYFLAPTFQDILRAHTKPGSTVDRIHLSDFPSFLIALPPINEQRAITKLLSVLDAKIELNRRMAGTLEAMAQALFKSWFVDFDPVHARAQGRSNDLTTMFPDSFDEEVPKGWLHGTIADVALINPKTPIQGSMAPYIDMAAIPTSGPTITRVIKRAPGSGARFCNGDTLVARITPCLENGKTALVDCIALGEVGWGSTEFIVLRPKPDIPTALPYLIARHQPFRDALLASMSGTSGRQRVPADGVTRWSMAVPPRSVLHAFDQLVSPTFSHIAHIARQSDILAALHSTLLPKLISGELRIADAERQIAAA